MFIQFSFQLAGKGFHLGCPPLQLFGDGATSVVRAVGNNRIFSGTGRISRLAAKSGIPCASFEIGLDLESKHNKKSKGPFPKRSRLDFNGECGFAFLDTTIFHLNLLRMWMFFSTLKPLVHPSSCWFSPINFTSVIQPPGQGLQWRCSCRRHSRGWWLYLLHLVQHGWQ